MSARDSSYPAGLDGSAGLLLYRENKIPVFRLFRWRERMSVDEVGLAAAAVL